MSRFAFTTCCVLAAAPALLAQPKAQTLTGPKGTVWAITFSPDSKLVAAASDVSEKKKDSELTSVVGSVVQVWDTASGELKHTFTNKMQIGAVAFSPDSKLVAVGSFKDLKVYDTASGALKHTFTGFDGSAKGLVFTPDGKTLISSNSWFEKVELRLWSLETGKLARTIPEPDKSEITSTAIAADGKLLATSHRVKGSGFSGQVKIWDLATGALIRTITDPKNWIESVALTPDGKTVAAPSGFAIVVWDAATGKSLREVKVFVSELTATSDGKSLVGRINTVGGSDVKVVDLATGKVTRSVKVPHKGLGRFALSPDGKFVAFGGGEAGQGEVILKDISR